MSMAKSDSVSIEQFKAISQRAGLEFTQTEMEHLLPLYQQFAEQLRMLHDPALPLGLPAVTFEAEWDS
jgi:hypothetical protein